MWGGSAASFPDEIMQTSPNTSPLHPSILLLCRERRGEGVIDRAGKEKTSSQLCRSRTVQKNTELLSPVRSCLISPSSTSKQETKKEGSVWLLC